MPKEVIGMLTERKQQLMLVINPTAGKNRARDNLFMLINYFLHENCISHSSAIFLNCEGVHPYTFLNALKKCV